MDREDLHYRYLPPPRLQHDYHQHSPYNPRFNIWHHQRPLMHQMRSPYNVGQQYGPPPVKMDQQYSGPKYMSSLRGPMPHCFGKCVPIQNHEDATAMQWQAYGTSQAGLPLQHQLPYLPLPTSLDQSWKQEQGAKTKFESVNAEQQEDKTWVNSWLTSKEHMQRSVPLSTTKPVGRGRLMTIPECRGLMQKLCSKLSELSYLVVGLSDMKEGDITINEQMEKCDRVKREVESIKDVLLDTDNVQHIQRRVWNVHRKRERLKRHNVRLSGEYEEKMMRRVRISDKLDAWLRGLQERAQQVKRDKQVKLEADMTVSEVRRKLVEANQLKAMLSSLARLREVRKDMRIQRGIDVSAETDARFTDTMSTLTQLVDRRKRVYEAEEHALQVMLDVDHQHMGKPLSDADTEQSETSHPQQLVTEYKELYMRQIFGNGLTNINDSRLTPFHSYYLQAESNPHAFIQIRREWDSYATLIDDCNVDISHTGIVPLNWVEPSEPTSAGWKASLVT